MKARIGCARARAGAWFDALSRGARGDQGGSRGARVARGNEPEPERDRSVDDLGRGEEIADPALAEVARERPQGDARLHRADDGNGNDGYRERVRRAEQRGQRRQGEDRILIQVPGLSDPQRLIDLLGKTAKMTFQLVDDAADVQQAQKGKLACGDIGEEAIPLPTDVPGLCAV